jgi:hypothetical protein
MMAGWWRCGECRSINADDVDHCPCLDEPEAEEARRETEEVEAP